MVLCFIFNLNAYLKFRHPDTYGSLCLSHQSLRNPNCYRWCHVTTTVVVAFSIHFVYNDFYNSFSICYNECSLLFCNAWHSSSCRDWDQCLSHRWSNPNRRRLWWMQPDNRDHSRICCQTMWCQPGHVSLRYVFVALAVHRSHRYMWISEIYHWYRCWWNDTIGGNCFYTIGHWQCAAARNAARCLWHGHQRHNGPSQRQCPIYPRMTGIRNHVWVIVSGVFCLKRVGLLIIINKYNFM